MIGSCTLRLLSSLLPVDVDVDVDATVVVGLSLSSVGGGGLTRRLFRALFLDAALLSVSADTVIGSAVILATAVVEGVPSKSWVHRV
eukprot:scaffold155250_cov42-Attheya_sp.AAC.3